MRENFMVWEQRKFLGNQSESPGSAVGKKYILLSSMYLWIQWHHRTYLLSQLTSPSCWFGCFRNISKIEKSQLLQAKLGVSLGKQ